MAATQISNGMIVKVLDDILNGVAVVGPFTYHLYSNNFTPDPASALGDFTEVTSVGYSAQAVAQSGWTFAGAGVGLRTATHTDIVFVVTAPMTAIGLFVTDNGGALVWSERFDSAVIFGALGGTVTMTPTLELRSPLA